MEAEEVRKTSPRRRLRRLGFLLYLVLAAGILTELLCRVFTSESEGYRKLFDVRLLPLPLVPEGHARLLSLKPEECPYVMPDPELGWTIKPGGRHPSKPFAADGFGLRSAPVELGAEKPPGVTRVLLIGDSFTHGDEVEWSDTWAARLQEELGPHFQVLNGGVPGYGTDQAFLRWKLRLSALLKPDIVVLAVIRDDLYRNVNLFRALYHHWTDLPWSKPRYAVEGQGLRLVNCPVVPPEAVEETLRNMAASPWARYDACWFPDLYTEDWCSASRLWCYLRSRRIGAARHNAFMALVREGGEAVVVTARIARLFLDEARVSNVRPIVIMLPQFDDMPGYANGGPPALRRLRAEMERIGVGPLDLGPVFFKSLGPGEEPGLLFVGGVGHPNARAARLIATALAPLVRGR
jgi:hypothetical protein